MLTWNVVASEATCSLVRSRSKPHGAPSCPISTSWPPTFTEPRRGTPDAFACTVYLSVASPCPSVGGVSISQLTCAAADQAHSRLATTLIVPAPPGDLNDGVLFVAVS